MPDACYALYRVKQKTCIFKSNYQAITGNNNQLLEVALVYKPERFGLMEIFKGAQTWFVYKS